MYADRHTIRVASDIGTGPMGMEKGDAMQIAAVITAHVAMARVRPEKPVLCSVDAVFIFGSFRYRLFMDMEIID